VIRWTGTHRLIGGILKQLQQSTDISRPFVHRHGRQTSIAWTDPIEFEQIRNWLNPGQNLCCG
jgi:phage-related protein